MPPRPDHRAPDGSTKRRHQDASEQHRASRDRHRDRFHQGDRQNAGPARCRMPGPLLAWSGSCVSLPGRVLLEENGNTALQTKGMLPLITDEDSATHSQRRPACCTEEEKAKELPFPTVDQATRTGFGRPRSSIRLRTWAAMATSVA